MMTRVGRFAFAANLAAFLVASGGCSTFNRIMYYPEPPQIYGGIRTVRATYEEFFGAKVAPTDSEAIRQSALVMIWTRGGFYYGLLFVADITATVVADTILLPFTVPADLLRKKKPDAEVMSSGGTTQTP